MLIVCMEGSRNSHDGQGRPKSTGETTVGTLTRRNNHGFAGKRFDAQPVLAQCKNLFPAHFSY